MTQLKSAIGYFYYVFIVVDIAVSESFSQAIYNFAKILAIL